MTAVAGAPSSAPPESASDPSPRRGRPRDERVSSAITAAALRQLDELGYAKVSMEGVAAEAGVARATVYRRYQDKADLLTAAIAENSTTHLATAVSTDPRGDLVAYLRDFDRRYAVGCLEVVGTLIGMREDPRALDLHRQRVVAPRMAYTGALLQRARELGQLRPDADLDLALQMLTGSVFARRVSGQDSPDGWAERAVDTIWAGMGPARPA